MNKLIAILVILGFILPMPVRAQISTDFDPVEKKLQAPSTFEQQMTEDARKAGETKPGAKPEEGRSNWWKWAIGAALVIGIAAAAGGGGGGGGETAPPPTTGTVGVGW